MQLPFTTSHAFIIGINAYQHLAPLSTAVHDAQALAEQLEAQHGFQVHPPLLDADHQTIRQFLQQEMPKLVQKDDRVLFYFAGHGIALDSEGGPKGYLVAANTKPGQKDTLLSMELVHDALTGLPCRHGLLILDCCFAESFKWSAGFRDVVFDLPAVIYEERFYQYTRDPAWQVITSSASDQKAVDILANQSLGLREENAQKHSPFAQALLDGIAGEADCIPRDEGDGVITATELYSYLRDRVEGLTTAAGKRQSPSLFSLGKHDKGQFIFLHPNHRLNLPPLPRRNPFMGLNSFNEEDANFFYGRDRVITALQALSATQNLIVVSGASGTGKSSVIKAGLLPKLRQDQWDILPIVRPGKHPMESLKAAVPNLYISTQKTVLVIDQYEELVTQCLHEDERNSFEHQIAKWLKSNPDLRIIVSVRADFEPQFANASLQQWWGKGRYTVPTFNSDELREVIIKPTIQEVLFFEPDSMVNKLVDAVNQAPGALPLLSFTLSELYHAYANSGRTNRALTEEDYQQLGGVIGALRTRANTIYDALSEQEQDSMRHLMLRMVSLEGGELASRRVITTDLQFSDPQKTKDTKKVADQLVAARLLSTGTDQQGRTYYEPAHDALVRAWTRLWEWIKAQGGNKLDLNYKLSLAVGDYLEQAQKGNAEYYLWHDDPRLDSLLLELEAKSWSFNQQEEAFLLASQEKRKRASRRNRGIIAGVIAVLLAVAGVALWQRSEAQNSAAEARAATVVAEENAEKARSAQSDTEEALGIVDSLFQAGVKSTNTNRTYILSALDLLKNSSFSQSDQRSDYNALRRYGDSLRILEPFRSDQIDGLWGYKDGSGAIIIAPKYESATNFETRGNGEFQTAEVVLGGAPFLINKQGEIQKLADESATLWYWQEVNSSANPLPERIVTGGSENVDGGRGSVPLYVGRGEYKGDPLKGLHPGKVKNGRLYIGYDASEIDIGNTFQILVLRENAQYRWIPRSEAEKYVEQGWQKVAGGWNNQQEGRALFVTRSLHDGQYIPGKLFIGRCHYPIDGLEWLSEAYEYLMVKSTD